jgi:DNA-binding NtrC family response regulator
MKAMPTILLIDDDPSQLKLYTWILERVSFAVVQALVGSTSVDLPDPANVNVDVVLLDFRLSSQLAAADIAELVHAKFPNAPIIVLSELPFMPEAARAYGTGFVPKGEPETLLKTVSAAVTLSQSRH